MASKKGFKLKQEVSSFFFQQEEPAPEEILQEEVKTKTRPAPEDELQGRPEESRETKSRRLQLLVYPSIYKALEKEAKKRKISVNELINRVLEKHTKGAN